MGKRIVKYRLELVRESSRIYDVEGKISSPIDVKNYIEEVFKLSSQAEEVMVMLVLDVKNNVIGAFEVSRGSLNASIVHPREVFKRALLLNGASIILAHNHPSGDPSPSKEDVDITRRIAEGGNILGIIVLDHLIIGDNGRYRSFREAQLI
jgi:DNA repair protein RadC